MRQRVWWLLLVTLLAWPMGGCRTRLPVGPLPAEEAVSQQIVSERPSPGRSPWLASLDREVADREGDSPTQISITTDRLRDLVRYRPLARSGDGPLGFVLRIDTCVPGEHDR